MIAFNLVVGVFLLAIAVQYAVEQRGNMFVLFLVLGCLNLVAFSLKVSGA